MSQRSRIYKEILVECLAAASDLLPSYSFRMDENTSIIEFKKDDKGNYTEEVERVLFGVQIVLVPKDDFNTKNKIQKMLWNTAIDLKIGLDQARIHAYRHILNVFAANYLLWAKDTSEDILKRICIPTK